MVAGGAQAQGQKTTAAAAAAAAAAAQMSKREAKEAGEVEAPLRERRAEAEAALPALSLSRR